MWCKWCLVFSLLGAVHFTQSSLMFCSKYLNCTFLKQPVLQCVEDSALCGNLSNEDFYLVWMLCGIELVREPSILDDLPRQLHSCLTRCKKPQLIATIFMCCKYLLLCNQILLTYCCHRHCRSEDKEFLTILSNIPRAKWVRDWSWGRWCTAVMNILSIFTCFECYMFASVDVEIWISCIKISIS